MIAGELPESGSGDDYVDMINAHIDASADKAAALDRVIEHCGIVLDDQSVAEDD